MSRQHPGLLLAVAGLVLGLWTAPAAAQDRADWPETLTIATETEGSAYDLYGQALAGLLGRALRLDVTLMPTGGSYQNAALMQTGDVDLALIAVGPMYDAWSGESPLSPTLPHDLMRVVAPSFSTTFQMMALNGAVAESPDGLAGATIGAGPAGAAAGIYVPLFFTTLGIDVDTRNGQEGDLAQQLEHGLIAALALADGVPGTVFAGVESDAGARLLSFSGEQQAALLDAFPALVPATVPPGTYAGQEDEAQTVAMWHFVVARADLPDDLVYTVTKTILENQAKLVEAYAGATGTAAANIAQNAMVPLHPGAGRYYEEVGQEIPEELKAW
ncbi:MAG: TAXI family TRAP transporter solute-binding subunit [Inquilinus sp.]|nr:TAXI family TRAP transporter solute-binding subunit [Inquilinus sp.]